MQTKAQEQTEKSNKEEMEVQTDGFENYPQKTPRLGSLIGTFLLLLVPLSMGLKIGLFSRDKYVREHFTSNFYGGTQVPDFLWGITNSFLPFGACIGALFITPISNKIGRKKSLAVCVAIGLIGELCIIISYSSKLYFLLALSRIFDGLSTGGSMNAGICLYVELLPSRYTRFCKPLIQLFINLGIVISCVFSLDLITRCIWVFTCIPAFIAQFILMINLFCLPESPRYVFEKTKNIDKALQAMIHLRGKNYYKIMEELNTIKDDVAAQESLKKISVLAFLKDKNLIPSIFVLSFFQIFQQLSGINAVLYFASILMREAKFLKEDLGSLLIISLCLFGSIVFSPVLSKVNNKLMVVIGYFGMSICFLAAFLSRYFNGRPIVTVVFLGLFLFIFQMGPGPLCWTITLDSYLPHQILAGQGFFTFINWSLNGIVVLVYLFIAKLAGFYTLIMFSILNFIAFLFLLYFLVETKGKENDKIMSEYHKKMRLFC